jgi:hypothetical protein
MHSCAWITLICKCGEYSGADKQVKQYARCPICGTTNPLTIAESTIGGQNFTTRRLPFFTRKPESTTTLPRYVRKAMEGL